MPKSKPEMEMPKPQQYVEERMPGGKYYDDGADWREWGDELSPEASASNIEVEVWQRFTNGIKTFGPRFLGQPVPAIKEEAYDILRYAEMAEKQIAWLTAENERLTEARYGFGRKVVKALETLDINPERCDWDHIRQPHGLGCFIELD